jgi:hypothetical protein
VMDDVAAALGVIDGLRVFAYQAPRIVPPTAEVEWPESIDYDTTLRRGSDRLTLQVRVMVSQADARSGQAQLAAYADGAGDRSVKAVVEAYQASAYDTARVTKCEFGVTSVDAVQYLSALFTLDIIGSGS